MTWVSLCEWGGAGKGMIAVFPSPPPKCTLEVLSEGLFPVIRVALWLGSQNLWLWTLMAPGESRIPHLYCGVVGRSLHSTEAPS